jgi:prepilin-type N-terminal cleavage/methylation domain-containing protein
MNRSERGFTLIELLMVVMIFGLMVAFAVPAVRSFGRTHDLKGTRDDLVAQIEMARAKAVATGIDQPVHFYRGMYGFDYHIHATAGNPTVGWNLPRDVVFLWPAGTDSAVIMKNDGRADAALVIPIANSRGDRDTVTVLASGMVLGK